MSTITLLEVVTATHHVLTGLRMEVEGNAQRFADGARIGNESKYVTIGTNNVWGASGKNDSSTVSYERIGYHSGSVDFIAGVLSTDCPVIVYRGNEKFRLVA